MSKRSDLVPLGDMYDAARRVVEKTKGVARAQFDADDNLQLAVTHLLQIIGEAARRVPAAICEEHPEIAWRSITGMRNRIVHDYTRVDFDEVWRTAVNDVPALLDALSHFVPPTPP
jgi:uncharacterized protein with HEPN domain